jgi:hypothetical protein
MNVADDRVSAVALVMETNTEAAAQVEEELPPTDEA